MAGKRAKRNSAEGVGSGVGAGGPSEPATDEPPPTTDSGRQRIVNELENSKNQKADAVSMIGQEIETKKHNYIITREIMKGRMSRVFEVRRNKDGKILAMKAHLPDDAGKAILLRHEAHIYHELSVVSRKMQKDEIRFMTIYDYGECSEGEFLFLTLGGESLANFLSEEKAPNFQTALDLSFQMLNVIEQIHTLGFIHSRIRPNTFITGTKSRERYTLFIINFSLARMANPTRAEPTVSRTPPQIFDRYAPRCQHFGHPYHRRDDLESWFYICCDLFHPLFLPWPSEKRLKSTQMAELKDKLMKGELYYRFTVMPKPFQAFAGAINETDAKMPNYNFFKECLMEEAKTKNCSFYVPWDFIPTASLPPVPESLSQTRIEFEFNQCVKNPTTFNFGTEKSRTILPEDGKEAAPSSQNSDVQILLPKPKSKSPASPSKTKVATPSKGKKKSPSEAKPKTTDSKTTKKNESVVVSMTDVLKDSGASESKSGTTSTDLKTPKTASSKTKESKTSSPAESAAKDDLKATTPPIPKPAAAKALSKESASSDEEDDEEEEEQFKLRSPPTASEKASSTGPILQTFRKTTKIPSPVPSSPSTSGKKSASKSSSSGTSAATSGTTTTSASGSSSGKSSSKKKISATKSASSTSIGSTTTTSASGTSGTSTSGTSTSGASGTSSTSGTSTSTTSGTTSGKTLSTNATPATAISFQKDVSAYLPINASETAASKSGTSNGSSSGTSLSSSSTSTNAGTSETSSGSSSGSVTPSTAISGNFQQSVYLCPK